MGLSFTPDMGDSLLNINVLPLCSKSMTGVLQLDEEKGLGGQLSTAFRGNPRKNPVLAVIPVALKRPGCAAKPRAVGITGLSFA
jgi:hypothetical protein